MKKTRRILLVLACLAGLLLTSLPLAAADKDAFDVPIQDGQAYPSIFYEYSDVAEDSWCYKIASDVRLYGLMYGTGADTFSPNDALTRADFTVILGRLYEDNDHVIAESTDTFSDTRDDAYYSKYIAWAEQNKLVGGYGNGLFGPKDAVTREQMATIIANYLQIMKIDLPLLPFAVMPSFGDEQQIAVWAQSAVTYLAQRGIVAGDQNGNFAPKAELTRAEAAAIFTRLFQKIYPNAILPA